MKLSFSIAKRFLTYSKGQTILIMLGIAVGISVQIFIGLLIQGLQDSLVQRTIGQSPHITIVSESKGASFQIEDTLFNSLTKDDRLIHVGKTADGAVFALTANEDESALLRGFSDDTATIYDLENSLVDGRMANTNDEVVLGKGLATNLNVDLNETITLQTILGDTVEVKVVGIFDLGVSAVNDSWIVSQSELTQELFKLGDSFTGIEMQVKDVFAADTIAASLEPSVDSDLKVVNWKAQNESLLSGLNGQSISTYMIQLFVLISVILGISSVLAITVLQKSRQIGILKAMGINDSQASLIFIFQGLILGILGGIMGVGLGVGLLVMFTTFAKNPDGTALIPITYDATFIAFSGSVAVISALLASVIPARKSKKLSPIEVIRNG
ncbi:MAG TPA: ABC transporter permease [Erysipelotrichaceae bacterium]|nr:ABC transporter permease [Erysipelotrichaceae bacterium]